jgi:hypothetical protein
MYLLFWKMGGFQMRVYYSDLKGAEYAFKELKTNLFIENKDSIKLYKIKELEEVRVVY